MSLTPLSALLKRGAICVGGSFMIGAPLGRMINPFVDASLFSLDMSIKVPACKPLKTKMTPRAETRQPNLTWARLGPPPPEQAELFQGRFLEFLAGKFSTHQQDAHMQPFTCLRQEPTVLVQFSTGRTWQNANWRVQAMAWIEKKWLLSSICQQHIVRKAFAKLWH